MSRWTRIHTPGLLARMRRSIELRRDDSVVRCWDASIRGDDRAAVAVSPNSFAVIRHLRALDDVFEPNADFLDRLEYELVAASPRMPHLTGTESARASTPRSSVNAAPTSSDRGYRFGHRYAPVALALALLLVLLTALPLAIQQSSEPPAIPAAVIPAPTMEIMAQLDFPPAFWDLPDGDAWNHIDLSIIRIDPGTSFSTDIGWYKAVDGPLILLVQSGELVMQPSGPALVYSAGHPDTPAQISAGTETVIGSNDTIVFSIDNAATGRNLGDEPVVAIIGSTGRNRDVKDGNVLPTDVTQIDLHYIDPESLIDTKSATVTIRRAELQPLDSFVYAPDPNWKLVPVADGSQIKGLYMAAGAIDSWSPDIEDQRVSSASALMPVKPATYTLFNLGDEPIDLYFLVVEPYPAPAATPASE